MGAGDVLYRVGGVLLGVGDVTPGVGGVLDRLGDRLLVLGLLLGEVRSLLLDRQPFPSGFGDVLLGVLDVP